MQRTIGPLPLIGGLQLGAPEGKPTGLLRALNVEARDGYCQRRRGCTDLFEVVLPGVGSAGGYSPASWAGQSVIYFDVGVPAGSLLPVSRSDFICRLCIGGDGPGTIVANEAVVDADLTFEFWGQDDAWHVLDVLPLSHVRTGNFISTAVSLDENNNSGGGALLVFIYPAGFKTAQPTGTPWSGRWIRMTRSAGTWALAAALEVWRSPSGSWPMPSEYRTAIVAPTTRTAAHPWIALAMEVASAQTFWRVYIVTSSLYAVRGSDILTSAGLSVAADPGDRPHLLYMPATDHMLASLGATYVKITGAADSASLFTPEIPDPDLSPYGDIPCRTSLPARPAAACIFGGRPFLAGFALDPQRIIWGAPAEFWTVWPESNDARISDAGGGKIIALIPADEVLYILTTVGIWRATLADPEGQNESNLFVDLVEEVRCTAPGSIIISPYGILFLASDGPRRFDGKRSKRLAEDIDELFRPDGAHAFPCLNHDSAVGVFHPLQNQYRISYRSPGAQHNDTVLTIDMEDKTAWIHGAELVSAVDAAGQATANEPIGQRPWGQRWSAACWVPSDKRIWTVHPEGGVVALDDGDKDCGHRLPWFAETQHLRIAATEQAVMEKVEIVTARDHFQPVRVSVIPDGDRARADAKNIAVQRDRLDTTAAIDGASLAGNITPLQLDESLSPLVWRGRKKARNHRVRIEGVSPIHHPARILSVTAHLSVEKESR